LILTAVTLARLS